MASMALPTPPATPPIEDSTNQSDGYALPRGGMEAVRLTAQHHVLKTRQGWLIHPQIAEAIKDIPNPQIADVATGTGIWAMEAAQQLPHADVVGLDISDQQFYPRWMLPSNMSLGLSDILAEVPVQYQGKFDVVHLRLLVCAGPAANKQRFIDHFASLLKPGGWLQWDDLEFPNVRAYRAPASNECGIPQQIDLQNHPIMLWQDKYFGMKAKAIWIPQLESILMETGCFSEAHHLAVPLNLQLLQMETELELVVMTNLGGLLLDRVNKKDLGASVIAAETQNALKTLRDDMADGVKFSYAWNVSIARKASS